MSDSSNEPDWIEQTVTLVAKSFERTHGNAFVFLTNEIKNAMLFQTCFSAKVLGKWESADLLRLHEVASSWYPRPGQD